MPHKYPNVSTQDERAVVDVLLNQIEFADVILINKCDLVEENGVVQLVALLR
jgi:G3E family GTPase